jgi:hypothetical protein
MRSSHAYIFGLLRNRVKVRQLRTGYSDARVESANGGTALSCIWRALAKRGRDDPQATDDSAQCYCNSLSLIIGARRLHESISGEYCEKSVSGFCRRRLPAHGGSRSGSRWGRRQYDYRYWQGGWLQGRQFGHRDEDRHAAARCPAVDLRRDTRAAGRSGAAQHGRCPALCSRHHRRPGRRQP